jgi:hypothetical protein
MWLHCSCCFVLFPSLRSYEIGALRGGFVFSSTYNFSFHTLAHGPGLCCCVPRGESRRLFRNDGLQDDSRSWQKQCLFAYGYYMLSLPVWLILINQSDPVISRHILLLSRAIRLRRNEFYLHERDSSLMPAAARGQRFRRSCEQYPDTYCITPHRLEEVQPDSNYTHLSLARGEAANSSSPRLNSAVHFATVFPPRQSHCSVVRVGASSCCCVASVPALASGCARRDRISRSCRECDGGDCLRLRKRTSDSQRC